MSSLKARVLVAVVGIPFLLLVLGWAPDWATMVLLALMCAVGAWELMHAVAAEAGKPLLPLTVTAAGWLPRRPSTSASEMGSSTALRMVSL